ncbi:hypothetical protein K438DRAFT_1757873 [Mycena galopus ATCC 62051]|nr:hypothetical protein K438DRAFT_1757873 [Mycena galopus ATCC 62051]
MRNEVYPMAREHPTQRLYLSRQSRLGVADLNRVESRRFIDSSRLELTLSRSQPGCTVHRKNVFGDKLGTWSNFVTGVTESRLADSTSSDSTFRVVATLLCTFGTLKTSLAIQSESNFLASTTKAQNEKFIDVFPLTYLMDTVPQQTFLLRPPDPVLCSNCHASHQHTEAYVYTDAKHLLVRITARQFGNRIPDESAHAPLRFAPPPPDKPSNGPASCPARGCSNQQGKPRQGSQKCIQYKCKTCCHEAANSAARNGHYRDSCKAHGAPGVDGQPPNPLPFDPAAAQPAYNVFPPHSQAPAAQPSAYCSPPSQPQRTQPFAHHPASSQPLPTPSSAHNSAQQNKHAGSSRNTALFQHPLIQPSAPYPARQSQQAASSRNPAQLQRGPNRGTRPLSRPMSRTWDVEYQAELARPDSEKVLCQKVNAIINTTIELVYHSTRLSDHPILMAGLQINENSWFDLYSNPDWKTMPASTFFQVDKNNSTLIRLRPSLLTELDLADCPGIENFLGKQSRKRTGTALVSPPKKSARTETSSVPGRLPDVIEIPDSPPSTFSSFHPPFPSISHPPAPALLQLLRSGSGVRKFPDSFSASEHDEAWKAYDVLCDSSSGKTNIPNAFPTLFPGAEYSHTTVTRWRNVFLKAPLHVREHYVAFGATEQGSWKAFLAGLRAVENGQSLVSIDPMPVPSTFSIPSAPVVKSEPESHSIPESEPMQIREPILTPVIPEPTHVPESTPTPLPKPVGPGSDFGGCDFCDRPFTIVMSSKLAQLLRNLIPNSSLAPTIANPNHRIAHLAHQLATYCKQHDTDMRLLPTARANSWPENVNYASLMGRVQDLQPVLQEIVENLEECESFQAAMTSVGGDPFKALTAYFGELGHQSILSAVQRVLVPEAIMSLICEDLDISAELASEVVADSTPFGLAYHSDTLDRDRCIQRGKDRGKSREEPTQSPQQPSPFPVSSPLLVPHALSPHLLPASWNSERRSLSPPSPLSLASDTLCNYCDEVFPLAPSAILSAMGEKLVNISWADPLPENPYHRSLPGITMAVDHCAQHRIWTRAIFSELLIEIMGTKLCNDTWLQNQRDIEEAMEVKTEPMDAVVSPEIQSEWSKVDFKFPEVYINPQSPSILNGFRGIPELLVDDNGFSAIRLWRSGSK